MVETYVLQSLECLAARAAQRKRKKERRRASREAAAEAAPLPDPPSLPGTKPKGNGEEPQTEQQVREAEVRLARLDEASKTHAAEMKALTEALALTGVLQ